MVQFISSIISLFIVFPVLLFFVLFMFIGIWTKNPRLSVKRAADFSVIFFILSVHFLTDVLWGRSLLLFIVLFILATFALFAYLYWRREGAFNLTVIFRRFWRFQFLIFLFAHFFWMIYGIMTNAFRFL